MKNKPWKKISEAVGVSTQYWTQKIIELERPDGQMHCYDFPSIPNGVVIIPVRGDGKVLMLKTYRPMIDRVCYEFPAGFVESGEKPAGAAIRELAEEANLKAENNQEVGVLYSSHGSTDQMGTVFVASGLSEFSLNNHDFERSELIWATIEEVDKEMFGTKFMIAWGACPWLLARELVLKIIDQFDTSVVS